MNAMMAAEPPLLAIRDLHVAYLAGRQPVHAVRGVSLEVLPGEVLAIVGESGSGKSTTAHAIIGLLQEGAHIVGGSITFQGEDLTRASERTWRRLRGARLGLVPQDPGVALNPAMRIGDQVAEVLRIHGLADRVNAPQRALEILDQVGLSQPALRASQYPHELSGGMRQRVLIGIAFACRPRLVIADEPTSALDATVQRRILDQLAIMKADSGTSVLLITHDLALAAERADRVIVMRHGQIVEAGAARDVFEQPRHAYTRALLAARPGAPDRTRRAPRLPSAPASPPLLAVSGLAKTFSLAGGATLQAVRGVSFEIARGETLALVGESGSGKSTTARMVVRMETPTAGQVRFGGQDIGALTGEPLRRLRQRIQFVHQNPYGSLDPRYTLEDILTEPLRAFGLGNRHERRARALELLDEVALDRALLTRKPAALSGGQRQRVAIARALALRPDLIVLDEPVSALDVAVQEQVLALLQRLQADLGLTYLLISHDLDVVRQISDQVAVMVAGTLVEQGPVEQVFQTPRHAYTRELLAARPGSGQGAPEPVQAAAVA
ncbi:Glutathione import ATP-binding protein GsiA [Achromobacter deleyi]|uniref:Glutathione import ATP-binding protein GsiA n=1 Tax=Achromobacter deleyi TaxID=1353891 RepID=A0A6S7AIQ4_9BURK|nr:ABC transporter ATP-binding protein [Achromobacter deleyi]CAB3733218.1 Glutathione import ATP-binding protein GsiA [Achromobacter deleyi]CAB3892238.1 Glutathione import ATP-binding protein GsiA [Achromobacter deleyi]CAB3917106.1 Glutathione import ATP-binding protein GsiA [Achromobacter deleyi]